MAIGIYGTTRPADVSIDDVDVYYNYSPNRETFNNDIIKLLIIYKTLAQFLTYTRDRVA